MDQVQDYGYASKNPWIYCLKTVLPDVVRHKYRLIDGKAVVGTLSLKRRLPTVKEYDKLIEEKKAELGLNKRSFDSGDVTPGQFDENRKVNESLLKRLQGSRAERTTLIERGQMMSVKEGGYLGPLEDGIDRTPPGTKPGKE
jgi:hypothetical protein